MPHDDRSEPSGARRDREPSRPSGSGRTRGGSQDDRRGSRGNGAARPRHGFSPRRSEDEARRYGGSGQAYRDGAGGRERRRGAGDSRGPARAPQRQRIKPPALPEDVEPADLERSARAELRALGRANAENVARHLVMVQRLLGTDPQAAYAHARYAASSAGRIAVVRETAGIAAYLSGHYTEALREIRAARRLSGLDLHRAIEADCERALGHHRKALQVASAADPRQLDDVERAELAMVVSSIREEMGQAELGLIVIEDAIRARPRDRETLRRLHSVRADRLEGLGRLAEAQAIRERIGPEPEEPEEDIEVFDIQDEIEDQAQAEDGQVRQDAQDADEALAPAQDAAVQESHAGGHGEDDAGRPESFAQRVEDEMRELLGEEETTFSDPGPVPVEAADVEEEASAEALPPAVPGSTLGGVPNPPQEA